MRHQGVAVVGNVAGVRHAGDKVGFDLLVSSFLVDKKLEIVLNERVREAVEVEVEADQGYMEDMPAEVNSTAAVRLQSEEGLVYVVHEMDSLAQSIADGGCHGGWVEPAALGQVRCE